MLADFELHFTTKRNQQSTDSLDKYTSVVVYTVDLKPIAQIVGSRKNISNFPSKF